LTATTATEELFENPPATTATTKHIAEDIKRITASSSSRHSTPLSKGVMTKPVVSGPFLRIG
jgi:hypothetical protein